MTFYIAKIGKMWEKKGKILVINSILM